MTALLAGNLLKIDQQDSDVAAGWVANGTNTTVTRDTSVFKNGPACVQLVATAAGFASAKTGYGAVTPVPAGASLIFYMHKRAATTNRGLQVLINWINASDGLISQSNVSTTGTDTALAFSRFDTAVLTSPPLTTKAEIVVTFSNLAAGESIRFDESYFGAPAATPVDTGLPAFIWLGGVKQSATVQLIGPA